MKKSIKTVLLIVGISLLQSNSITSQEVEIQYLANEGVSIKTENVQILVDAIFKKEFDYLDVLANTELEKFKHAKDQYKSIDIILATHLHGDHFNSQLIGDHLNVNKKAVFLAPKETINKFQKEFSEFQNIAARVKPKTPDFFKSETVILKNITIQALRLQHFGTSPWKEAENLAYLITIEGKKILHLGDAQISIENLKSFNLASENIDVAVLPYWQLGSPEQLSIIDKYINPKQILVAHIPLNSYSSAQENINLLGYKNTTALTKPFQKIIIK